MSSVAIAPAGAGAGAAVVGYFVATAVVVPALIPVLLRMPPLAATLVVLGVTAVPLVVAGVVTSLALHRRRATGRRSETVPTAVVAGAVASLVVAAVGSAAALATGEQLDGGSILVTVVVFCGAVVAGALVVPPRTNHERLPAYGAPSSAAGGDAGQGSVEVLGVSAVAAMLVLALVLAVSPDGRWLGDSVRVQLCRIVTLGQGGGCGSGAPPTAEREEPSHACTLEDVRDNRATATSVSVLQGESGDLIRVETLAGGKYRVSREGTGGYGLQVGEGGGVSWTVDDTTYGAEAQAAVSGAVTVAGGMTWVVSEAEKDDLVDYLKSERNWNTFTLALESVGTPRGIPVRGITDAGRALYNWATDAYVPRAPDETYQHGGVHGSASGSFAGVISSASGEADQTHLVGYREDTATGRVTAYYVATVDVSVGGQLVRPANDKTVTGKAELVIGVTYDPDGYPVNIHAQGLGAHETKTVMTGVFSGHEIELLDGVDSDGVLYDASLSVTGEESLRIATGFLLATGIATDDPLAQWKGGEIAVSTFMDAARERGTLTRQQVTLRGDTSFALQAGAEVFGLGLGTQFENSTQEITTSAPQYWNGRDWAAWTGCAR